MSKAMRFLADMGVSQQVVEWLRANGHDAIHLREEGLQRLPNGEIFQKAGLAERDLGSIRRTQHSPAKRKHCSDRRREARTREPCRQGAEAQRSPSPYLRSYSNTARQNAGMVW
jgi:hypothetical protein